jgi:large conductance mechanosensitive channel
MGLYSRAMSILKEFRDFAMRGNVVDLAVGVIIGGAFGAIVKSLVDDIIMPLIGRILGNINFANLYLNFSGQQFASLDEAKKSGGAILPYGAFVQNVVNFFIIAFCVFLIVKLMQSVQKKKDDAAPPAATPEEVLLLREIRDNLKK